MILCVPLRMDINVPCNRIEPVASSLRRFTLANPSSVRQSSSDPATVGSMYARSEAIQAKDEQYNLDSSERQHALDSSTLSLRALFVDVVPPIR